MVRKFQQQKETFQEDDYLHMGQDLDLGIGIFEEKDWVGKLLGQPILICTTLVGYMCDKSVKKC